jgi:anti-sigma B factor antagonist
MDIKAPIPGLAGPLEVRTETAEDGSRRICLGGAVDLPAGERLLAEFSAALTAQPPAIVVDMTEVGFCSSTGLEALVRLHQRGREAGVPVRIRPTAQLRRLIDLTGLTGILDLAP